MKDKFEWIEDTLLCAVESQISDLSNVDTAELGEVIDMIKDLEEAKYYCTVTKAMHEGEEEESRMYYTTSGQIRRMPMYGKNSPEMREMSWEYDSDNMMHSANTHHTLTHTDPKEGKSYMSRKNYMEAKELHKDKTS